MKQLTSATARRWAGYNRRRAKNRAADVARRRANAEAKRSAYVSGYDVPKVPPLARKRLGFRVTVECLDDGARTSFVVLRTPFGLTIAPGLAGKKVACVLREYSPA